MDKDRGTKGGREVLHSGLHSGTFEHPHTVSRVHGENPHSTPEAKPHVCNTPVAPTEHKLAEFASKEHGLLDNGGGKGHHIDDGPMTAARLERKVIAAKKFI